MRRDGGVALLSGATGFVGRAIAIELASRDIDVIALTRAGGGKASIPTVEVDLFATDALSRVISEHRPRFFIHAAGRLSAADGDDRSLYRDNLDMTVAVADAVARAETGTRLVFVGSAAQYGLGTPRDRGTRETDPVRPVSAYGASKAAALLAAHAAGIRYGFETVSAVLFNLIGPGQPKTLVPATFITRALDNPADTLEVGNIAAKRDFIDIRDAAGAIAAAAFSGQSGAVYNIGRGEAVAVSEILARIREALGGSLRWNAQENRFGVERVPVSYADIAAIGRDTGWRPSIALDRSIEDMIAVERTRRQSG